LAIFNRLYTKEEKMGIQKVLGLQRRFSDEMDKLCKKPIVNSQEQVKEWQSKHIEYLKIKSQNIMSIPDKLRSDIDEMFKEHEETYISFVEHWFQYGFADFNRTFLIAEQKNGNISKEKMREKYKKIQNTNVESISRTKKVDYLFFVFEKIIDYIYNNKNWFDLYKSSSIRGDGLVLNISSLDLFAWQLPNADLRNINNYKEIAKIMTIFFFIEKIYKNESCFSNDTNPFNQIVDLDKIVSYYYFAKEEIE